MSKKQLDEEKQRFWEQTIREAARSGVSIRAFCRQRRLKEGQFHWWRRKLKKGGRGPSSQKQGASFALVSDETGAMDAGIELVLGDGRRLRIRRGVDEETLRAVLAAMGPERC